MVIKPYVYITKGKRGLVQPALKCRGREYLRIIYGPEYTIEKNLKRLRKRGLNTKRSLAIRELALGIEALERFIRYEPLRRVHECVFGVKRDFVSKLSGFLKRIRRLTNNHYQQILNHLYSVCLSPSVWLCGV